jgi:hypothetical protein
MPGQDWNKPWRAIEQEMNSDLAAVKTDEDASRFMRRYFSAEYLHDYLKIYRSIRSEMGKTPGDALAQVLELPPL